MSDWEPAPSGAPGPGGPSAAAPEGLGTVGKGAPGEGTAGKSASGGRRLSEPPGASGTPSRRRLIGAGIGLAAAAAGGAAGYGLGHATSSSTAADVEPPDGDLMREHGVLKRILLVYRAASSRLAAGRAVPAPALFTAAQVIHDYIEGFHEALEEGYVFPTLLRAGVLTGTVETLLLQHARGRQITQSLLQTVSAAGLDDTTTREEVITNLERFVTMYEPHEAREDTVVFPAYRSRLSPEELTDLGRSFARLETQQFGPDGFNTVVGQVASIERDFGIYDLSQFTPPGPAS